VDAQTNMPGNAGVLALVICGAWYFYFYGANLTAPIFGAFSFDSSELPIITTYAMYIPMFVVFAVKEYKKSVFRNGVMPVLATVAALFMIFVAVYAHGIKPYREAAANGKFAFPVLFYLIVFTVIMIIGAVFYKKRKKAEFE
jgi:APA family basic amino acid/polyamine antiporter